MTDDLATLARLAGVSVSWTDAFGHPRSVIPETLRRVLSALGLACDSPAAITASIATLRRPTALPPLLTADAGGEVTLPHGESDPVELDLPTGRIRPALRESGGRLTFRAPTSPGYHRMQVGVAETVLAVAPPRAISVAERTGRRRGFGAALQVYGLRRPGDGGIGDFGALADAAHLLGASGADALAISPTHALFAAHPGRAGPYAPSSRLVLNPLLADPTCLFGPEPVAASWRRANADTTRATQEHAELIDWETAGAARFAMLRALFDDLAHHPAQQAAYTRYAATARPEVTRHATFEALHAWHLAHGGTWNWRDWPADLQRPDNPAVARFAAAHRQEVAFHVFLQFLAETSLDHAQAAARNAGMGIGLIADLAVGMDASGSHAWSRPEDLLTGLSVGAPPDLLNQQGQRWGLTTFSPTALRASGFAPFLATLRTALRHAGGVRIDHVMGLRRLWLVPDGLGPAEGAYLDYPLTDLLRLLAIESHAHTAVVIGEDLGTVPPGFRETMAARGILGMRVLPFERDARGNFRPPGSWQADALAMTSTHDMPPIAGWWRGGDLEWRARLRGEPRPAPRDMRARRSDCAGFWNAAVDAGVATGRLPTAAGAEAAVDAAIGYVAASPCALAIVPIEDLLAQREAPNLPGTVDEHPNWRRRLPAPLNTALASPRVAARLAMLRRRRGDAGE